MAPRSRGTTRCSQRFAGWVVELPAGGDHDEPAQHEAFAPGRRLRLLPEGVDDDGDPVVGVWDADGVRRAGYNAYRRAALVAAALEHGLAMEALVLAEERALLDDRRVGLTLLVHPAATLRVDAAGAAGLAAPRRRTRDRVVLLADSSGELRWWDPSGRARAELGQRYAIGLQGPGMSRPAWSPGEMSDDDEELS
jgi:hypothetical protein